MSIDNHPPAYGLVRFLCRQRLDEFPIYHSTSEPDIDFALFSVEESTRNNPRVSSMPTANSFLQRLHQHRAWANEKLVEARATLLPCSS
jgi:hypothetical protein